MKRRFRNTLITRSYLSECVFVRVMCIEPQSYDTFCMPTSVTLDFEIPFDTYGLIPYHVIIALTSYLMICE